MGAERRSVVVVEVRGRRLGIPSEGLVEIRAASPAPSATVRAPEDGWVEHRGLRVPVLDAVALLEVSPSDDPSGAHLLVFERAGRRAALRVDRAVALRRLDRGDGEVELLADLVERLPEAAWVEARAAVEEPVSRRPAPELEVLCFTLGEQPHALELDDVAEVRRLGAVARVPGGFPALVGLIAVRDELVPLVDLELVRGRPPQSRSEASRALLLRPRGAALALLVEAVLAPRKLERFAAPPSERAGWPAGWVQGVAGELVVLNGQVVLESSELGMVPRRVSRGTSNEGGT